MMMTLSRRARRITHAVVQYLPIAVTSDDIVGRKAELRRRSQLNASRRARCSRGISID